jgi:two-component system chemotaxis response regulator CheB
MLIGAGRPRRVVVMGASMGGIEALGQVLPRLTGAPSVVVVLHLASQRPSLVPDLLAAHCALPVKEAEDKEPLAPGTIYFAPPDHHLLIERTLCLALSGDGPVHHSRPSIDVLFESAAEALGPRLAAVLLTGANADGAAGLAVIAATGGTVVVQDPGTARAAEMPRAGLALCPGAHVLPLDAIAPFLNRLASSTGAGPSPQLPEDLP